jgi:hypothetical protein
MSVYVLLGEGLAAGEVTAVTDAVADGGGRLAVAMSARLLVLEPGPSTVADLQALPADVVLAVGDDDVAPLQAADPSPDVLADVLLLALTTSAATAGADTARTAQGLYWPGIGCLVEED